MKLLRSSFVCLGLGLFGPVTAEEPSLPGKDLEPVTQEQIQPFVQVCESCHGTGGQSTREEVPVIAGRKATEIMAALEQFYYYERHCPDVDFTDKEGQQVRRSMCDITNEMNKQEGLALAAYFENADAQN